MRKFKPRVLAIWAAVTLPLLAQLGWVAIQEYRVLLDQSFDRPRSIEWTPAALWERWTKVNSSVRLSNPSSFQLSFFQGRHCPNKLILEDAEPDRRIWRKLGQMNDLRSLLIHAPPGQADENLPPLQIEEIADLKSLKMISLAGFKVTDHDLQLLEKFPNLETLVFGRGSKPEDWSHLNHSDSITSLEFWDLDWTEENLRQLSTISTVETLGIYNSRSLDPNGLKHIFALPALERLAANYLDVKATDLRELAGPAILRLLLEDCSFSGDLIGALSEMESLRQLQLTSDAEVKIPLDLQNLPPLPHLYSVQLSGFSLGEGSLQQLSRFEELHTLALQNTRIHPADYPVLKTLPDLARLEVDLEVHETLMKGGFRYPSLRNLTLHIDEEFDPQRWQDVIDELNAHQPGIRANPKRGTVSKIPPGP